MSDEKNDITIITDRMEIIKGADSYSFDHNLKLFCVITQAGRDYYNINNIKQITIEPCMEG